MTDIVEQMEVAVQAAVEDMPYRWLGPNYPDERGVEIYDTLREFFENTWQSDNADAYFKYASTVAVQAILPFIEAAKAEGRREMREEAAAVCERNCEIIGAAPYSSIHSALIGSAEAIRNLGDTP